MKKTNEAFDNVWKEAEDTGNIFLGSKVEIHIWYKKLKCWHTRGSKIDIKNLKAHNNQNDLSQWTWGRNNIHIYNEAWTKDIFITDIIFVERCPCAQFIQFS